MTSLPSSPSARSSEVEAVLAVLLSRGAIDEQALERGRRAAASSGERPDMALNKLGLVSDEAFVDAWTGVTGLGPVAAADYPENALLREELSPVFLEHAGIIPLALIGNDRLVLAVRDPLNEFGPAAVGAKLQRHVECRIAKPGEFAAAWRRLYGGATANGDDELFTLDAALTTDIERLRDLASDAPVVRVVNDLIDQAITWKASDLHLSTTRTGLRVRYRVDGILRDVEPPPSHLHAAIVSRLKIMAGLDIGERRLPQDGRIRIAWRGREIDLRIATMPHLGGEGVVLRVLDRSSVVLDLPALGLSPAIVAELERLLVAPHGIFLVTGPTGSGKTTTLYAALRAITQPGRNIVTIEDPVEFQLEGVNQVQVNRRIGLDFATALRALLRQDPDVIMVGEIRDRETAAMAVQAALTGHLVLATVHTNTAVAALPRLVDMGVEPFLLASTVRGAMAQRLVRRLCPQCRRPGQLPPHLASLWQRPGDPTFTCFEPTGCENCRSGYAGRVALAEVMVMNDGLRGQLLEKADETQLTKVARTSGMSTLIEDGIAKIAAGVTSVEEVLRVIGAE